MDKQRAIRAAILSVSVTIGFFIKKHLENYEFTAQSIATFLLYFLFGFGVSYLILSIGKKNGNRKSH